MYGVCTLKGSILAYAGTAYAPDVFACLMRCVLPCPSDRKMSDLVEQRVGDSCPACVGEILRYIAAKTRNFSGGIPRLRGVKHMTPRSNRRTHGTSPHSRGKCQTVEIDKNNARYILAYAEYTRLLRHLFSPAVPVHPRPSGEQCNGWIQAKSTDMQKRG